MKAKVTVSIDGCSFEIGYAAAIMQQLYRSAGVDFIINAAAIMQQLYRSAGADFIITSAKDGEHDRPESLHYTGDAFDCRTRLLTKMQGDAILASARAELEPLGFDVVDERPN